MTRALARVLNDLKRLTRKEAGSLKDESRGPARFARRDLDAKAHADQRGGHEVDKAGEGLNVPEHGKGESQREIQVGRDGTAFPGGTGLGDRAEMDHSVPVLTSFGPEVDAVIAYDPVLTKRIGDLQRAGWTFDYSKPVVAAFGAWVIRSQRKLRILEKYQGDPLRTVCHLAHEVNHAHPEGYQPREIPFEGRTRTQWIEENIEEHVKDEGDAVIEAQDTRARILNAGGPDIGVSFELGLSRRSYEQYAAGHISREEAREAVGRNIVYSYPNGRGPDNHFDIYWSRLENEWDQEFGGTGM